MMIRLIILLCFMKRCLGDDLLSARCQSQCLHLLSSTYQENAEMRRNLKHHILSICKDDRNCSSCTMPCREALTDRGQCDQNACSEAIEGSSCEKSCDFLHQIFSEKPGLCPSVNNVSNYECTAECRLDGDCGETAKCCVWGCSRRCLQPTTPPPNIRRKFGSIIPSIPPLPLQVSVQERKRKRSVVVRWEIRNQHDPADLYVVEWRWGLHPEAMTNWQTVALKNKDYAILKHLLSPGRYYQFRVAAVNRFGTRGFSEPSVPFKLSKEAKAPSAPREIKLGEARLEEGKWSQLLSWIPPTSDLPITGYQVSWTLSNEQEAKSYDEMLRRQTNKDKHEKRDLDEEEWTIVERDRTTVIVPSHATQTNLERLEPNSIYLVEIQATAESAEGQLSGEKALELVRTRAVDSIGSRMNEDRLEEASFIDVPTGEPERFDQADPLQVQTAHFTESLVTQINWLNSRICGPQRKQFLVKYSKRCSDHTITKDQWKEEKVIDCSILLEDLDFQCLYSVQVFIDDGRLKPGVIGSFETRSCEETPTAGKAPCDFVKSKLKCLWDFSSIDCEWDRLSTSERDTIIGYRVVLSSAIGDGHNISILPPQTRRTRFDGLSPWKDYNVEVQPITNRGVGMAESVSVSAIESEDPSSNPGDDRDQNQLEIIELPLESSALRIFTSFSISFILMLIFLLR